MPKADVEALETNFAHWQTTRGAGLDESTAWLSYCAENCLKHLPLSDEDIRQGIVDGGNDGGVDALYILADDYPADLTKLDPKSKARITILGVQVKSKSGFERAVLDRFDGLIDAFFDKSKDRKELLKRYNPGVVDAIELFRSVRDRLASIPDIHIEHMYIVKKDNASPSHDQTDAVDKIKKTAAHWYSNARANVTFVNAEKLME